MATKEERIDLAKEAATYLEKDSLFQKVLRHVQTQHVADLLATVPGSPEALKAHQALYALSAVESGFRALVGDGSMAKRGL